MSADLMRRAAALIRERAEAATEGPWEAASDGRFTELLADDGGDVIYRRVMDVQAPADAEHISSWDPTAARAVADLLDAGAEEIDRRVARDGEQILERANPTFHAMTELARTYLREDA